MFLNVPSGIRDEASLTTVMSVRSPTLRENVWCDPFGFLAGEKPSRRRAATTCLLEQAGSSLLTYGKRQLKDASELSRRHFFLAMLIDRRTLDQPDGVIGEDTIPFARLLNGIEVLDRGFDGIVEGFTWTSTEARNVQLDAGALPIAVLANSPKAQDHVTNDGLPIMEDRPSFVRKTVLCHAKKYMELGTEINRAAQYFPRSGGCLPPAAIGKAPYFLQKAR